jgi:hypothetical protein
VGAILGPALPTVPTRPGGWKLAWELRQPVEGEPDYPEWKALVPDMIEYQQARIEAQDAATVLAALDGVDIPVVQADEQREIAHQIASKPTDRLVAA